MKIAGRVLPAYRGEYSSSKTYDILDTVTYRNSSWLCIRSNTTGIIPSTANSDNWHLISLGISPELNQALNDRVEQYDEMVETVNEQAAEARDAAEVAKKSAEIATARSNAIVQTASGESIVTNDSSDDPLKGLRVFGKTEQFTTTGAQLFDVWLVPSLVSGSNTQRGVTTSITEDGALLFKGTPTVTSGVILTMMSENIIDRLVDGNDYVCNLTSQIKNKDGSTNYATRFKVDKSTMESIQPYIQRSVDNYVDGEIFYPMMNEGTILLPYEPYTGGIASPNPNYPQELVSVGDDGDVEVGVYGGNLFDFDAIIPNPETYLFECVPLYVGCGRFTLSTNLPKNYNGDNSSAFLFLLSGNVTSGQATVTNGVWDKHSMTVDADEHGYITISYRYRDTITSLADYWFMLNKGETALPYEPYKEPQTLTALTPSGLPGIQITDASLATYTDSNGQMWCCDEVDYGRGVRVKRLKILELNGVDENWGVLEVSTGNKEFALSLSDGRKKIFGLGDGAISNVGYTHYQVLDSGGYGLTYAYGVRIRFENMNPENNTIDELKAYLAENPITVIYPLAEPIETPLSEEEIAQYRALHTNYPVTTILNDSDAHMEVKYNADTKTYIDNKFAELQTALVALGGI